MHEQFSAALYESTVIDTIMQLRQLVQFMLSASDESRIIEMAWEDRTPFEAIEQQFGLSEKSVIKLMRSRMKASSFRMWRKRVSGRATKHLQLRSPDVSRGYCPSQYKR